MFICHAIGDCTNLAELDAGRDNRRSLSPHGVRQYALGDGSCNGGASAVLSQPPVGTDAMVDRRRRARSGGNEADTSTRPTSTPLQKHTLSGSSSERP